MQTKTAGHRQLYGSRVFRSPRTAIVLCLVSAALWGQEQSPAPSAAQDPQDAQGQQADGAEVGALGDR